VGVLCQKLVGRHNKLRQPLRKDLLGTRVGFGSLRWRGVRFGLRDGRKKTLKNAINNFYDRVVFTMITFSSNDAATKIGVVASYTTSLFLSVYVIVTFAGLASLESSDDPIGDPYFSIMELLILCTMPPMLVSFDALHEKVTGGNQIAAVADLCCRQAYTLLAISTGITSVVHAAAMTAHRSDQIQNSMGDALFDSFFAFEWPSIVYVLDILAWDWFFGLAMVLAAISIPWGCKLEKALRVAMLLDGTLSLLGLIAIPLDNMNVRMIGIVGYAVVSIVVFALLGIWLGRSKEEPDAPTIEQENTLMEIHKETD